MSHFNPYREWLGIEVRTKPTYYQLLGLSPKAEVGNVRRRANRRIRKLAKLDVGHRATLRQQIIDRIDRAAKCLADKKQKAEYDRRLKEIVKRRSIRQSQLTSNDRPQAARPKTSALGDSGLVLDEAQIRRKAEENAGAPATDLGDRVPPVTSGQQTGRRGVAHRLNKKRKRSRLATFSALMAAVSLLGVAYLVVTQTEFGEKLMSASVPSGTQSTPERPIATPTPPPTPTSDFDAVADTSIRPHFEPVDTRPEDSGVPKPNPDHTVGVTNPPPPAPVVTQAELRELGESLTSARQALSNRDTQKARDTLERSERLARRPRDKEKHDRLMRLTEYVASYWQAARDELKKLRGGNEIEIGGSPVMIVEKNARHLILRMAGRNKTYPVDDLPVGLATELADRWLATDAASTKVLRGAMMAVTPGFDKSEARRLWRAAELSGEVDLGDLELVLDDDYQLAEKLEPTELP